MYSFPVIFNKPVLCSSETVFRLAKLNRIYCKTSLSTEWIWSGSTYDNK